LIEVDEQHGRDAVKGVLTVTEDMTDCRECERVFDRGVFAGCAFMSSSHTSEQMADGAFLGPRLNGPLFDLYLARRTQLPCRLAPTFYSKQA